MREAEHRHPTDEIAAERTFMFTDIVSSTAQHEQMGTRAWSDVLERHRRSVAAIARTHRGRVVTFMGDGFMVVFDDPAAAATCALRLQYALRAQNELGVRIGLESGEVVSIGEDHYVGLCVHTASRLCDLSGAGEALLGGRCVELAHRQIPLAGLRCGLTKIRGLSGPVLAYLSEVPTAPWLP